MHLPPHLVPAKDENREESGLEEKGEDALRRKRAAEDVAYETRIRRPVCPELEFHDDTCRHADGEGEREDLRPESSHLVIDRRARLQPERLDHYHHHADPDAERRINVMKRNGEGELEP